MLHKVFENANSHGSLNIFRILDLREHYLQAYGRDGIFHIYRAERLIELIYVEHWGDNEWQIERKSKTRNDLGCRWIGTRYMKWQMKLSSSRFVGTLGERAMYKNDLVLENMRYLFAFRVLRICLDTASISISDFYVFQILQYLLLNITQIFIAVFGK